MQADREVLALKEWRLRKYWTVRGLAKKARVSTETLIRAEKGGKVWEVTARKIADALDIQVNQVAEFVKWHIGEV